MQTARTFMITYPNGRNTLRCYLTWIERRKQETVDQNPLMYLPFPESYCVTAHSLISTTRISIKALVSKTHMKLHCQKNHRKGLWSSLIHKHLHNLIWKAFRQILKRILPKILSFWFFCPLTLLWGRTETPEDFFFFFYTLYLCSRYLYLHLRKKGKEEVQDILYLQHFNL